MVDAIDLSGQRVLILEDDYFLATDAARAVEGAGAMVLGPCPDEGSALARIASSNPTAAVLDINLGSGPRFETARALLRRKVPFVFLTGYDDTGIPEQFATIARFLKPADPRRLLDGLRRVLRGENCP